MVIRLLDAGYCAPRAERKRLWLGVGDTLSLGRSLATAEHKIYDDCRLPLLVVRNPTWGQMELVLTQHRVFNLRRFAPVSLIPRALAMEGHIPVRFFLEFVKHEADTRGRRRGA